MVYTFVIRLQNVVHDSLALFRINFLWSDIDEYQFQPPCYVIFFVHTAFIYNTHCVKRVIENKSATIHSCEVRESRMIIGLVTRVQKLGCPWHV